MKDIRLGKNIILTPEGLAVFKDLKLAAAADLHIGFEESMGEQLARIQTKKILEKFLRVIGRFGISEIIINGDIKYSFGKESKQEWEEIRYFLSELLKKVRVKIAKGNHDFYIENMTKELDILISREFEFNGIVFAHGDSNIGNAAKEGGRMDGSRGESSEAKPARERSAAKKGKPRLVVMGNEHPAIKLRDEIGAIRKYPCFLYAKNEKVLVLPAANPWTYGTDLLSARKENLLSPVLRTISLEEALIYALEGEEIYNFGKVRDVRELLLKKQSF